MKSIKQIKIQSRISYIIAIQIILCYSLSNTKSLNLFTNKASNCIVNTPDGNSFDLSSLKKPFDHKIDVGTYSYKANFCGPLVQQCGNSVTPAAIFDVSGICLGSLTSGWENMEVKYIDDSDKSHGIRMVFKSKGGSCINSFQTLNSLVYSLKCDPNAEDVNLTSMLKINNCSYEFIFTTKNACVYGNSYLFIFASAKTILMVIVLALSFYLVCFTYLNLRNNPDDGVLKSIPNREFWIEFIECVGIGVRVTINRITGKQSENM